MENFNATFYTLVSLDTEEVKFADARQQHLVENGFFFEIIKELPYVNDPKLKSELNLILSGKKDQDDFLDKIMKKKDAEDMKLENENCEKDKDMLAL